MVFSDIEYGVYDIDLDYINCLIAKGLPVADPNQTIAYIGPVATIKSEHEKISLFVPVHESFNNCDSYIKSYANGNAYGFLDFTKMIPVTSESITYRNRASNLTSFAQYRYDFLTHCANCALIESTVMKGGAVT